MITIYLRQNTMGKVIRKVDNRIKSLPHLTRLGMRKWGELLEKKMVASAKDAGIKSFTGKSFRQIKWRQNNGSNYGELVIPNSLFMVDSMTPHRWWITNRFRKRVTWGLQASNSLIRRRSNRIANGKLDKFSVMVRPHPFIRKGFESARKNLRVVLKEYIVNRTN